VSYFDDYQKRLNASGTNEADAFKNSTINFIDRAFSNSPNYRLVPVDGVDTECRIINTDSFKTRDMILRPGSRVNIGSLVVVDSYYFLITDFVYDNIISKARLTIASDMLRWKNKDGVIKQYHLVGETASRFNMIERANSDFVSSQAYFYVQRNPDTDTIVPSQRFIIGGKVYHVIGIDNVTNTDSNGLGISQLIMSATPSSANDDFINGIADNSFLLDKEKTNDISGGSGGALW